MGGRAIEIETAVVVVVVIEVEGVCRIHRRQHQVNHSDHLDKSLFPLRRFVFLSSIFRMT